MPSRASKNNVVAGGFLIGSVILGVAISFWLGGLGEKLGSKNRHRVIFPIAEGARGLKPGSEVTLGGLSIGRVIEVQPRTKPDADSGHEVMNNIEVVIAIDAGVLLFEDARAELVAPLLGGVSAINFAGVGTGASTVMGADGDGVLETNEAIVGYAAPGMLAQLGFGPEQTEQIKGIIANAHRVSQDADVYSEKINTFLDKANQIAADLQPDVAPSSRSLRETMASIEAFSANLAPDGAWKTNIDGTLTDARAFAASLPETREKFDQLVSDTRGTVGDVRTVVNENRERIARSIKHVESITQRVRFESIDQAHSLIDKGKVGLATYTQLGDRANQIVDREYPGIRATLHNVKLSSEQAKLALEELRAQPWRLLKQPSKEDLKREPLYRAARTYASAVSDLRAASEALESVIARPTALDGSARPSAVDVLTIQQMTQAVQLAFGQYEKAEREMLDALAQGH